MNDFVMRICAVSLIAYTITSCFDDEFLVGAICFAPNQCGSNMQCINQRCRPNWCQQETCPQPYHTVCYKSAADECQEIGMDCIFAKNEEQMQWGFCADLCVPISSPDLTSCPPGPENFSSTCMEIAEQMLCVIDCSQAQRCPTTMECLHTAVGLDLCFPVP